MSLTSGALLLGIIGFLVLEGLQPDRPPAFDVALGPIRATGTGYHVPIAVRNTGGQTAESIVLRVALEQADSTVEESRITLDWVPGRSQRAATAVFRRDPRGYRLTGRIESFRAP